MEAGMSPEKALKERSRVRSETKLPTLLGRGWEMRLEERLRCWSESRLHRSDGREVILLPLRSKDWSFINLPMVLSGMGPERFDPGAEKWRMFCFCLSQTTPGDEHKEENVWGLGEEVLIWLKKLER